MKMKVYIDKSILLLCVFNGFCVTLLDHIHSRNSIDTHTQLLIVALVPLKIKLLPSNWFEGDFTRMAPALTSPAPGAPHTLSDPTTTATKKAPKSIFPDGIRTSGQHEPIYSFLQPYSAFPKEIAGPTAWSKTDYASNPERWTHIFSADEVREMSEAADAFIASGTPLTGITKDLFPLPNFSKFLEPLRKELVDGKGFILFKGMPVEQWGNQKSAVAYMGLGTYLGYFVSQNSRGHVLGHVKDLGEDATAIDKVRIYRTNARQFFHADDADLVGLLCVAKALEGGESDLVSLMRFPFFAISLQRYAVLLTCRVYRSVAIKYGMISKNTILTSLNCLPNPSGTLTAKARQARDKRNGSKPPYSTWRRERTQGSIASKQYPKEP